MHTSAADIEGAAERLLSAASESRPCSPVRDLIGSDDVVAAYAVQRRLTAARLATGGTVVGRKIGLTSAAVQQQLGVDQPDFGVLFADMAVTDAQTVECGRLLQPRIEAEVAFVLSKDLVEGPLDAAQMRASVDYAVAALEIVDSRISGWDITFGDTVADNGSSGMFLLGPDRRPLTDVEPVEVDMTLSRSSGASGTTEQVSSGNGAACLGDPLEALAWLACTARDHGDPLRAGDVVLSGALGPMVAVNPGDTFEATISGLGRVGVSFS